VSNPEVIPENQFLERKMSEAMWVGRGRAGGCEITKENIRKTRFCELYRLLRGIQDIGLQSAGKVADSNEMGNLWEPL